MQESAGPVCTSVRHAGGVCLEVGDEDSEKQVEEDVVAHKDPDDKVETSGGASGIHAIPHHVMPVGGGKDLKHLQDQSNDIPPLK